jgi:tetratricopeptide (TPR) repeat protein
VYQREIDEHQLNVANMLGLAEIRIENGELSAALELLYRMTLTTANPFEAQDPAAALLARTGHFNEAIPFLEELTIAMPWNAEYRVRLAQAKLQARRDEQSARKELAAVAQDMKASYDVRSAAAQALAGTGRTDLGSRELNLLAGAAPTLAEANQPFFFRARLSAAARLDNASQKALLRAALEEYPYADGARVLLLRAAMQAGDYHLAVATMKPFLRSRWLDLNSSPGRLYETAVDEDSEDEEDPESGDEDNSQAEAEFTQDIRSMTPREKAEIFEQVGLAFQKLGAFDEALSSLGQALGLHPIPEVARRVKAEVREVRKVLEERRSDRERQPDIHDALEQESVVRPRLSPIKPSLSRVEKEGGHR